MARKRATRRRSRRARKRALSAVGRLVLLLLTGLAVSWVGCFTRPPGEPDDLCSIFSEKRSWYKGAKRSADRWGVPEAAQLAIIHRESSFRAIARPPRRRFLWILPGPRASTAYGYGQVLDSTWSMYKQSTGRAGASRDEFGDVADFIGWYGDVIHRRTGISKHDAARLYLAYHEGPDGYKRGTHQSKGWLLRVSQQVGARAERYERQYDSCKEELGRRRFLWFF